MRATSRRFLQQKESGTDGRKHRNGYTGGFSIDLMNAYEELGSIIGEAVGGPCE